MFAFKGIDFKTDRPLYNVTAYPELRMLRVEKHLYRPIQWQPNKPSLEDWDLAMARLKQKVYQACLVSSLSRINRRTCFYSGPRTCQYPGTSPDGYQGLDAWWCTWDGRDERTETLFLVFLRRIQRAIKRFLSARRHLAVCMALHDRLGRNSLLASLPADVLVIRVLCG